MRISIKQSGSFKNTEDFLTRMSKPTRIALLQNLAMEGVNALMQATPVDTSETALSWGYDIQIKRDRIDITWTNYNMAEGVPVVILLQYGHANRGGGFVQGRDFINPAMKPVFDRIEYEVWREVTKG